MSCRRRTFWEEAIVPRLGVFPQEPAIAKVIVSLDKLDAVPAPQTKLVRTPGQELVCSGMSVKREGLNCHMRVLRTTTSVSPGLHCSVWVCDRCMFAATAEASWAGAVDGRVEVGQQLLGQSELKSASVTQAEGSGGSSHHAGRY
jgi:hypothetical protein